MIEGLRALGANTVVIDANAALLAPGRAARRRLLSDHASSAAHGPAGARRLADQDARRRRRLPAPAARCRGAAVGAASVPRLFADMCRYAGPDGVVIDMESIAPARPAHRRRACPRTSGRGAPRSTLDRSTGARRLVLAPIARRPSIDPRLRLMLAMDAACRTARLGRHRPAAAERRCRGRRRRWPGACAPKAGCGPMWPAASPSLCRLSRAQQVEALRQAQRQGASAFALAPSQPTLPPSAALAAAFSAATYPYRP